MPTSELSLMRFFRQSDMGRIPVGAGFLVGERYILTCAHVVADALGVSRDVKDAPHAVVKVDLPLLPGQPTVEAHPVAWVPAMPPDQRPVIGKAEDIAVLELEGDADAPAGVMPASLLGLDAFFDRSVRVCGFPEGMDAGDWLDGQLKGLIGTGRVQLDYALGSRTVVPGFSGAPVWDKVEGAVIGMIVSTGARAGVMSAYMMPVATLAEAWPALKPTIQRETRSTKLPFLNSIDRGPADLLIQALRVGPLPQFRDVGIAAAQDPVYPVGAQVEFELRHNGRDKGEIRINHIDVKLDDYSKSAACPFTLTGDRFFGAGTAPVKVYNVQVTESGVSSVQYKDPAGKSHKGKTDDILALDPPVKLTLHKSETDSVETVQIIVRTLDPGQYKLSISLNYTTPKGEKKKKVTSLSICTP
jgi:S1-C subfamily serine protease